MRNFFYCLTIFLLSFLSRAVVAADSSDTVSVESLEQAISISTVLTDTDSITYGFSNVELDFLSGFVGDFGESTDFQNSIEILAIPFNLELPDLDDRLSHSFNFRLSYVDMESSSDSIREQIYGGFVQYIRHYQVNNNFSTGYGVGVHLSYYQNDYTDNGNLSDEIEDLLDGDMLNTSALMLMVEPVVRLIYEKRESWGTWTLHNSNYYLFGQGIAGGATDISDVQPEGWRLTNGIKFKYNIPNLIGLSDFILLDLKRVDIGGDMSELSDNGNYYEVGVGWIFDTKNAFPLIDNVGLGINVNYGSDMSGASLVLYFNE